MNEFNSDDIVIVGAGVAGMITALALAAHNIPSTIYEKSKQLQEVGAGLQLAPNASKLLERLGLLEDISPFISEPQAINLCNGRDGKTLLSLPMEEVATKRWGAPYYTIHRADLQKILKEKIDDTPLVSYHSGCALETIKGNNQSGFNITFQKRQKLSTTDKIEKLSIATKHVIFCDGVWSSARSQICGEKSEFSSYIAWRATLPKNELPDSFLQIGALDKISAFMNKDSHFIVYPLRKGSLYNFVIVTKGHNIGASWSQQGDKQKLLQLLDGQASFLHDIVEKTPNWTYWPLFKMPFPRFLGPNGEIFLGDSSHAVTPFAAQGAAQAIEDACALAESFKNGLQQQGNDKFIQELLHFDKARNKRLKFVASRGDFNKFVYHLSGPIASARNLVMRLRPQNRFIGSLDALYGYDATKALDKEG